MKRRVTCRVESPDGRILPGASSGGTYLGDLGNPVLTDKPGGAGDAIQVLSSKAVSNPELMRRAKSHHSAAIRPPVPEGIQVG